MDPSENIDFESASGKLRVEKLNRYRRLHHIGVRGSDVTEPLLSFPHLASRFAVDGRLISQLSSCGFTDPTPVQRQATPLMLEGREVLVCAPTGSGKTLAFLLPLLQHVLSCGDSRERCVRALVLSPTVELAAQTLEQCRVLGAAVGVAVRMETCWSTVRRLQKEAEAETNGGKRKRMMRRLERKVERLKKGGEEAEVLVSTPKRLTDAIEAGVLNLDKVEWLVFDEADRLFEDDNGCLFRDQVAAIFTKCTSSKVKRAMFSATTRPDVEEWARFTFDNPVSVRVGTRNAAVTSVTQTLTYCGREAGKLHEMKMLLIRGLKMPCLVFMQSRERARLLHEEMAAKKVKADIISGDKSQKQREEVLRRFRDGKFDVLICTDVLCRGIDLPAVEMVVNYDLPPSPSEYVHRIGRTGRAGREGVAVTLWTDDDFQRLRPIAHLIRQSGGSIPPQLNDFLQKAKRKSGRAARKLDLPDRGDLRGYGRKRRHDNKSRGKFQGAKKRRTN